MFKVLLVSSIILLSGLAQADALKNGCGGREAPQLTAQILCSPANGRGPDVAVDVYQSLDCSENQRYHILYKNSSLNYTANGSPFLGDFNGGAGETIGLLRVRNADHVEDYLFLDRVLVTTPRATGIMTEVFAGGDAGHFKFNCSRMN